MKKRLLACLLTLVMLLALLPATALAADPTTSGSCGENLTWTLTQNKDGTTYTLTISGTGEMEDYTVGGAPWHVALGAAANRKQITEIVLPNGLTHIGNNAFLQAAVTKVEIPNTVVSIGTNAFWNCNTIETTLPASVRELGATAFYGTFVVNVDANSPYLCCEENGKVLYSKDKTTLYQVSQNYAGEFTIPSTVMTINDYAMYGCKDTSGKLVIPDSVQTIGQAAFYGTGFTTLDLGNGVKEIGTSAFNTCSNMKGDLVIPASVTSVGESAFHSTGFDGALNIQAQIKEIPDSEFSGAAFTSVVFSGSVKRIDKSSFKDCHNLTSAIFSDNVEDIGDYAFSGCTKLTSVTFGKGLQVIGKSAFANSGLSGKLMLPDSLKRIDEYAFANCPHISEITLPEGSMTIGYAAFYQNTGVQTIRIPLSEIQFEKSEDASGYHIFTFNNTDTTHTLETIVVGTAPAESSMSLFSNSLAGLKTIVIGTGVSEINDYAFGSAKLLERALYPKELKIDNLWNGNHYLIDVGTKYTVAANGNMGQNTEQAMLTFETPEGKTCPTVTYLSTNESAVTVDKSGKIKAIGSVGQKATIKAQYDGTTFAKVDVTIGVMIDGAFYSINPVIADQTYTGLPLTPAVEVTADGQLITEGFTVEYVNNINVGTATATVKVGDAVVGTATFQIVAPPPAPVIPVTPSAPAQLPFNPDAGKTKFTDVAGNAWYASAVNYAVDKGLMNGTGEGEFSPEAATTRGMIVTILARLDGKNTSGTPWYQAGQRWAMEYEISDGSNMTGAITREQLVTMLFRYAVKNGLEAVTLSENLTQFTDASDISAWAVSAMQWAVGQGLIQGSNGQLRPQANASRAEVATILMRFCELLNK